MRIEKEIQQKKNDEADANRNEMKRQVKVRKKNMLYVPDFSPPQNGNMSL